MGLFPRARAYKRPLPPIVAPLHAPVVQTTEPVAPEYAAPVGDSPPTAPATPAEAIITTDGPAFIPYPLRIAGRIDH